MTRKLDSIVSTLGDMSPAEKRLLEKIYQLAKRQLATGYDTTGRPVCSADFCRFCNYQRRPQAARGVETITLVQQFCDTVREPGEYYDAARTHR